MNSNLNHIILHLSLIDEIGPATISKISSYLEIQNLDQIYSLRFSDLLKMGLKQKMAEQLVRGLADKSILEKEIELIEKNGISWTTIYSTDYPELLKTIHVPPAILYWRGTLPDQKSLCVVGSRDANTYGTMAIDSLIPALIAYDFTIISGGAKGIDTLAHQKVLKEGGKTVAVLGSGLLKPYPAENIKLFQQIVEAGGAVISSFGLLTSPVAEHFPARNRIIAGLSKGCIVVQAAIKSGARITADYALSEGREVFAVPGPINDRLSAGCHELIKQGAKLAASPADILIEFGYESAFTPEARQVSAGKDTQSTQKKNVQQALVTPAQLAVPVDPLEDIILNSCAIPCAIDELLEVTGLPLIQVSKLLFDLQVKGLLCQNMAGLWESFGPTSSTSPGRDA